MLSENHKHNLIFYNILIIFQRIVSPVKVKPFDALVQCQSILDEFRVNPKHKAYVVFFLEPVDIVKLECPNYFEVIKQPMDLRKIQGRIDNNLYKDEDGFAYDMRLMFDNCIKYNGANHPIAPFCKVFQDAFEEKFARLKKAKEKSMITIFKKLDDKEAAIKIEIQTHRETIETSNQKIMKLETFLEIIKQQREEEILKMKARLEDSTGPERGNNLQKKIKKPKEEKKPKVKKIKKKPSQPRPIDEQPLEVEPIVKSDSEEEDSAKSMTYDEMRTLSIAISTLSEYQTHEVVNIVKKREPEKVKMENDEAELEFQNLKPITLRELEKFVNDLKKPKPGIL